MRQMALQLRIIGIITNTETHMPDITFRILYTHVTVCVITLVIVLEVSLATTERRVFANSAW